MLTSVGANLGLRRFGGHYTLEYKNVWANSAWTPAQTVAGTGGTITLTDSTATNPARFYRVRVQ